MGEENHTPAEAADSPKSGPENRGNLHETLRDQVGQDIVAGRLVAGTIIKAEDLRARYDVSLSVVREVVRVLESLGMLQPIRRVGLVVLAMSEWMLLDPLVIRWRMTEAPARQVRSLTELRVAIEPEAAGLAAQYAPAEAAEEIMGLAARMRASGRQGDVEAFLEADVEFHRAVLGAGGNSHFRDTIARGTRLEGTGIEFAGVGISGGEVGALLGPSLMVGGSETAWQRLRPLLEPIAAKVGDEACVDHIGTDGAGHFVKMVHNGIEYADMQLISEAFTLLRDSLGMTPSEIAEVFADWNTGELESYLIEITADVLAHVDEATGRPFVDIVADAAKAKGTGAWTAQVGLDLGVPVPTIAAAVFSRSLSSAVDLRAQGLRLAGPRPVTGSPSSSPDERAARIEEIGKALLLGKVMAYVQGFHEIAVVAAEHGWDIDLGALAGIWRAGCIIRARLLDRIVEAFDSPTSPESLLAADFVHEFAKSCQESLRTTVIGAIGHGIAVPGLSSTLAYFDGLRTEAGSAALIQAQRDRFGSHTYARTDRPGTFHTLWSGDRVEVEV